MTRRGAPAQGVTASGRWLPPGQAFLYVAGDLAATRGPGCAWGRPRRPRFPAPQPRVSAACGRRPLDRPSVSVREPPAPTAPPAERRPERGKRPRQASHNAGTLGTTSWGLILVIAVKLGDGWSERPSSLGFTCASKRRHSPLSGGPRALALQPAVRRPGLPPRVWASPLRPAAQGRGAVSAPPPPTAGGSLSAGLAGLLAGLRRGVSILEKGKAVIL